MTWPFSGRDTKRPLDGLAHVLSSSFQSKAATETLRWDKEWMRYFSLGKDYWFYFYDMSSDTYALAVKREKIAEFTCEQMFNTTLIKNIKAGVWATGADIVGKDVLEIGCGPGVFGRVSGRFANSYVGVDVSRFALSIAKLTSPKTCRYIHMYEPALVEQLAKSVDVSVGRNFFIHHNYEDSLWLLRFLRDITRDGGLVLADMFADAKSIDGDRRLTAADALQDKHPSTLFNFEDEDIERLAKEAGLTL